MYHDIGGWWTLWMVVTMLVFWGGAAFLVFWWLRALGGERSSRSPDAIARERYARGEITRSQYDEIRRHLAT